MSNFNKVLLDVKDQIAFVTLNRPEKHNALDAELMHDLLRIAKEIKKNRTIRAVILQGNGPSFCSGLDMPSFSKKGILGLAQLLLKWPFKKTNLVQDLAWVWRNLPVPVLAVPHGKCFGGGFQLLMSADFRIASKNTQFSILEAKWGMIPDMTAAITFPEVAKIDTLKELTMTGRIFNSEESYSYGLLTHLSETPLEDALRLANEIKERSPDSVAATKKLFNTTWTASNRKSLRLETWYQLLLIGRKNWRIASKQKNNWSSRSFN